MKRHLHREINALKQKLLALGAAVEDSVYNAVQAVVQRDASSTKKIVIRDSEIDQMEVDVEEECLKILALHQPVALDLRLIIAILKINNDLERIGDLAVNIAQRAAAISRFTPVDIPFDLPAMSDIAKSMFKKSLDSLVNEDEIIAREVLSDDDEIDQLHSKMYKLVAEKIVENPENVETLINHLGISKCLERIADLATNISEDVIYMISGEIVRHNLIQELKENN